MGIRRNLTEDEKKRIAEFYKSSNLSIGALADALGYSRETIKRYKDHS